MIALYFDKSKKLVEKELYNYNSYAMRTLDAYQSWLDFWKKVGDFFMVPDTTGVNYLTRILFAVGLIVVAFFVIRFICWLLKRAFKINKKGPDIDRSAKYFIVTIIKIFLWLGVAFIVIGILKIDMTGAAGVASAITVALGLALQDLLGCLFSGLLLLQQKNIKTGEYISVKNAYGVSEGTVENIHLFLTYLRTPQGQIVTIPNNNMTAAAITNYTRLGKRRIDYDIGVAYDTDIALAKAVFHKILEEDDRILKDEVQDVYLSKLDSYSVQIRLRCWTGVDNYWPVYNDLSEKLLLACRDNKIYIPSSTDIKVNENK